MAAGDVYKLTAQVVGLGSTYMNVPAFRTLPATDPTQADWQVLADDFKEAFRTQQNGLFSWNSWRSAQVFGDGVTYGPEDCKRHGGRVFAGNFSGTTAGSITGTDALPPQNALVITLQSPFIGRSKRGRIYVFGLSETAQASGTWTGATITAITTGWTTFMNKYKEAGSSPNFQLGVWSERIATGCVWDQRTGEHVKVDSSKPDQAFTPIAAFQVRSIVYNQRRRTLGVGR